MHFSWQILPKMFQNEARCRLVYPEGGAYTTSGCNGSDQNFSECPQNIECHYSLEKPHIRIGITLDKNKIKGCFFRVVAGQTGNPLVSCNKKKLKQPSTVRFTGWRAPRARQRANLPILSIEPLAQPGVNFPNLPDHACAWQAC